MTQYREKRTLTRSFDTPTELISSTAIQRILQEQLRAPAARERVVCPTLELLEICENNISKRVMN